MKNVTEMTDQNILKYESLQKHTAELLARAQMQVGPGSEHNDVRAETERLAREHDRLSGTLDQLKQRRASGDLLEDEIEREGPMSVWEVIGQDLEKLVEKLTNR